ncbi:unnamed protein product [Ceutorhynchus assimilis]|uniref:Apolipophorins n=1 Tax=Ceutorhynchus assimilis TaxID=467358 RepID=A0A9N9MWF6_9CUCU|nr:unnamed protein product [Ceutorhynchus assimilis]
MRMDSGQHRTPHFLGLVLVLLVIGNVQTEEVCPSGCKSGAPQTFKFTPGTAYKYNYDGKIDISLSSAEGQSTSTEVKAEVVLIQEPDCRQLLKLQNVQILGSGKKHASIPDIEKPIRINNQDGILNDRICVVDGDNQNSINIKRAIASLFQAATKSSYETDIFGRCPTEFSSHKEGNIVVIQKSRSLNKCSYREHIQQDFLSTALNLDSEIKSSPLLNGDYNSLLKIKNGILDQATVTEDYLYVPFSVGKNGAKAQVVSKLQFIGTSKEAANGANVKEPRSIIFENPHPVVAATSDLQSIVGAVKDVVQTIDVVVGEGTAKEFSNLLKIVRVAKKNDMLAAYNQVQSGVGVGDKETAKRVYLDALLSAGNGDSVEALLELLDKKQLNEIDSKLALIGLNIVRHATEGSLKSVVRLLDTPKLPREAYLGIGNLAGRFCQQHDCENNAEIKALTNKLLSKIGAKLADKDQENDAIFALKALANFRHFNDNVIPKLISVAQNKNLPNRVRVAALEAFLADACKDKLRNSALQILQDIQQDSEVRIKAYLAVAQCPNAKVGNAVKTLLAKEPSIQVGGFITSHIHALRSSANPDKALAKQFLGFSVRRSFPIDPRKYSFSGDFSYAIDTLGLGASSEANVIYSQNSWLPRSSSLNLTAEIFGHSFNFLEIETRQENLDKLVEHYFGPKGLLRTAILSDLIKGGKSSYEKLAEYVEQKLKSSLRSKRDVSKAELDQVAKHVQIKTNELNKDLDLDLSLRAFGAEVLFLNINQEAKIQPEAIIDKIVAQLVKGLDGLQRFEETLRHNHNFLDAEFDYPTSLGFPLRLAVEGTANIQIKAEGNVDVRKLLNNPDQGELRIKLIPSANIEVAARLTLDSLVIENGLKVVSTLYSSTGGDLRATWNKQSGFDLKFGLPVQEQKLISANHEIVFITREPAKKEVGLPLKFTQVKDFSICFDQLSPFIGLTFCAEINGPNVGGQQIPILPFPLAGDARFAVSIENEDVSEFHIRHDYTQSHADFVLETIGKNNQKKVSLAVQTEISPEKFIRAIFSSPIKTAQAEARIVSTNVEKSLLLKLQNDQETYSGKIGYSISGTPERAVYKPLLEYKTPAGQQQLPISTEGQIVVEQNGQQVKLIFENVKVTDGKTSLGLNGNLGRDANGVFFTDLVVSNEANKVDVEGRVQLSPDLIKFNIKVENTFNNNANFNLKGEFKRQASMHDASLQLIHGADLNSKSSILTISHHLVNKYKSPSDFSFETKNSFSYPLLSVSGKFELEQTPNSLDYEVNAEYGELKLGSELEAQINKKSQGDYEIEFDLWGLDNKLEIKSRREVMPNEESKISNTLEVNGKKFEVEGKIRHNLRAHNVDLGTDLTVSLPSQAAPIKVNTGLIVNEGELDSHVKISSGNEHIIDAFLKANKKGNANGSLKINLKNKLNVNGQIHSNNGAGNGEILVDLQNGKRQIKADTTFTIQPAHVYDITATLYPSFNKDKNMKIVLSTNTKVSESSLDSKNKVDILGHPLEVNLKGSRSGDRQTGKIDGELEVTLPGEQYLLAKSSCQHEGHDDLSSGQQQSSIEYRKNKNSTGRKYAYKTTWKNANMDEGVGDVDINMSADGNGKNINADISVKSSKNGDDRSLNLVNKVSGSLLRQPYEISMVGHCKRGIVSDYEVRSSYGQANTVHLRGNHDFSGPTKKGKMNLQVASEHPQLRSLNVDLDGNVVKQEDPNAPVSVEGSVNVQANNDQGPIVDLKSRGKVTVSPQAGQLKLNLALNKIEPIDVTGSYDLKENQQGGSSSVTVNYGKGQTVKYDVALDRLAEHQYKLVLAMQTPIEGYKSSQMTVNTKRVKENHAVSDVVLVVDGKTWKTNSELIISDISPLIDFKLTTPEGKVKQLYFKANKISNRQFDGAVKLIDEQNDFIYESSGAVNVEDVENLIVKGQVNSPKLNLDKIEYEAHNKGGNGDRKMQVSVKTAGKNYISGNLNYAAKEENGKFIIDGHGNFKVKDESKSGNFKYIIEQLDQQKNGEQGVQISFDAAIGSKAVDSEYKLTNKHFRLQNSYCEQKKECAYFEVDNKINANDAENYDQVLEINLDLRKLGLSHEFGLKSVTTRKHWVIDHTVDAHFQNNENSKYQYSFYVHPSEAGISLATPKRIVALEAKNQLPKNLKDGGKGSGEISFFMDKKNHPNKKTALTWAIDVNLKGRISGDAKFTHPGLTKPLSASFTATRDGTPYNGKLDVSGELDVFAQANQKLIAQFHKSVTLDKDHSRGTAKETFTLQSTGLGIDIRSNEIAIGDRNKKEFSYEHKSSYQAGKSKYENLVSTKMTPTEVSGELKLFNKVLLKGHHRSQIKDNEQTFESEVSSYDNKPLVSKLEIKNLNTLAYSLGYKNEPQKRLLFNAGLIPGQIADVRGEMQDGGNKVNLFYASIKLDDANFLKSEQKVDSKAIEATLQKVKERATAYLNGLEQLSKEWSEQARQEAQAVSEIAKKSSANIQPLRQYYTKELQELREEILNDKSVKELSESAHKVLGSLIAAVSELFEKLSHLAEESAVVLQNSFNGIVDSIDKSLLPELKELGAKGLAITKQILETAVDISLGLLARASQIIEQYQPEFQEIVAAFGEVFRDIGRVIYKAYENASENIRSVLDRITNELRASPFIEELRAQYEQFLKEGIPSADAIIGTIREIFITIKDAIPPEFIVRDDISKLLDDITSYAEKKLKNQPVDDRAALEEIVREVSTIIKKLLALIKSEQLQMPGSAQLDSSMLPLNFLKHLPRLAAVKFSPISYLLDQPSAEIDKLLWSLFDSPKNLLPPFPLFGLVIQGQHLFTFDGKHLTFPGKCNYLLARDAVNGNFTLAGSYKDGILASITLADKEGSITLVSGGKVKSGQDAVDLPYRKTNLAAWRDYEIVTLLSTAGVTVICTPDLLGCSVKISGFYHGQVRGLLGNGNKEPYDDLTIPNGKIVTAEGQFGNAYKMSSSCPDVAVPKHESVSDDPACTKLFNWESDLALCYPFVPNENFKMACNHGMAAKVKGTEEAIAKAYVAACQERNILVHTPERLVQCTNSDKTYNVGDTFSVKLPSKSADIVLVVETEKSNQALYDKLVKTLVPEITTELHNKGIRDIEFHLITYGGLNQWPSHVTVNGKLTFKGRAPALTFDEEPKPHNGLDKITDPQTKQFVEDLKSLLHDLSLASGLNLKARTFDIASKYPFRVNALKSIIVVNSKQCEVGRFYHLQKLFANIYKNNQISLNLFTPFESLTIKDAKKSKDIVGFNQENVFTLSQAKKSPKGTAELHKELNYDDYCVDFTLKNRGNAFVNNNFLGLSDAEQKQYTRLAATNIADQLVNLEQGLDCECKLVNPWTAGNVCTEAYSKDRPSKKV